MLVQSYFMCLQPSSLWITRHPRFGRTPYWTLPVCTKRKDGLSAGVTSSDGHGKVLYRLYWPVGHQRWTRKLKSRRLLLLLFILLFPTAVFSFVFVFAKCIQLFSGFFLSCLCLLCSDGVVMWGECGLFVFIFYFFFTAYGLCCYCSCYHWLTGSLVRSFCYLFVRLFVCFLAHLVVHSLAARVFQYTVPIICQKVFTDLILHFWMSVFNHGLWGFSFCGWWFVYFRRALNIFLVVSLLSV